MIINAPPPRWPKTGVRAAIEAAMTDQSYTDVSTAPSATLRFLAAPTDVNWGGKTHGGTVMRSGDPRTLKMQLRTHCLTIFVALDKDRPIAVRRCDPVSDEDIRLDAHARHLMQLRSNLAPIHPN